MEAYSDNKSKYYALLFTIVFHALLFLLFIMIVFITPLPPFKEPPAITIETEFDGMMGMGSTKSGGQGDHDNKIATTIATVTAPPVKTDVTNAPPDVITDPTETTVVKTNPKKQKETKTEVVSTPAEEKISNDLQNALNMVHYKKDQKGKGEGTKSTGGSGLGGKQGIGNGPGNGTGNGPPGGTGGNGYSLIGRTLLKKPDRMTDTQEEGIVVVEIIVDETGRVIKATPGQRGSNTNSAKLYGKARQAALSIKFNPSPDGAKEQIGTYTFVFTFE